MIQLAICDDESQTGDVLEEMLLQAYSGQKLEIDHYKSGEALLREVSRGIFYDIIFLDIEMPETDGIETGIQLRKESACRDSLLIYITAHTQYILRCFDALPFEFIRKPFQKERVKEVMERAVHQIEAGNRVLELAGSKDGNLRWPIREIMWFEIKSRHQIRIVMKKSSMNFRGRLDDIEKELRQKGIHNFVRVHQSYLINMDYIFRYNLNMVWMEPENGREEHYQINIGRKYKREASDKITAYFIR